MLNGRLTDAVSKRSTLKALKPRLSWLALVAIEAMVGCSATSTMTSDASDSIRTSLDKAGYKDVSLSKDRDRGVLTLSGLVAGNGDKSQATSIARSIAGSQAVSNQITVTPLGAESDTKALNSDLDKGIGSTLDAALIKYNLHHSVKYAVKNHGATLIGGVDSQSERARAEKVASAVLNVLQVVNELQVNRQRPPRRSEGGPLAVKPGQFEWETRQGACDLPA